MQMMPKSKRSCNGPVGGLLRNAKVLAWKLCDEHRLNLKLEESPAAARAGRWGLQLLELAEP